MKKTKLHLLLADDDMDDCDFFQDAIAELSDPLELTILNNGVELMEFLLKNLINPPHLIFLDLNMPRKSGMECVAEIKAIETLSQIPIIIYSTSLDQTVMNKLYQMGAHHYIQKPAEFANIKNVIKKALNLFDDGNFLQLRSSDNFVIQP